MQFTLCFLLIVLFYLSVADGKKKKAAAPPTPKENQTITPWEYCEACKATVDLYSRLSTAKLQSMQNSGAKPGSALEASSILEGMCENEEFVDSYIPAMRYGCYKLTYDNVTKFLTPFEGQSSAANARVNLFDIKKEVGFRPQCVRLTASVVEMIYKHRWPLFV